MAGAVGPVALKIVQAVADEDPQVARRGDGRWHLQKVSKQRKLRESDYCVLASRQLEDGASEFAVTRVGFEGVGETTVLTVPVIRSEDATRALQSLVAMIGEAVPSAYRFPSIRGRLNHLSRLHLGRTAVRDGLCLSKLGRRCFPDTKIKSAEDIAAALELGYVRPEDPAAMCLAHSELLLGLLEKFEARDVDTVDGILEDLQPMVTSVDFEAYSFDEDDLNDLPTCPGVYVMRDSDGKVIYVGKSVHLRDRVKTYFARRSEREEKTQRILERIWTVEVQEVGSELEALILEARLIQTTRPEFNKQVEVHERESGVDRPPFLILLPSADVDSVELFCVRGDCPIRVTRVRKDLSDWEEGWADVEATFDQESAEVDDVEMAAHRILSGWVTRRSDTLNTIDVGDPGSRTDLRRVLEDHIKGADSDEWEKVWRV